MQGSDLEFIPLHFGDKLRVVNPLGRIGIITLWSRIDYVENILSKCGADASRVAVIGNLYGNGIPHLVRNLLHNPQVRDIVICGNDRSGSAGELVAFFEAGVEEAQSLGNKVVRIVGTRRIIDDLITPHQFVEKPRFVSVGDLSNEESVARLREALQSIEAPPPISAERVRVEMPEVVISYFPSEPRAHTIVRETPLDAWRELVFRLVRFGHPARLRKGDRQELQNVKVVIECPFEDDVESLTEYGFSLDDLRRYQREMLEGPLPPDHSYTYGNRIREYFGFDALQRFAVRLRENPQDRDCYLALWDSSRDIDSDDAPCLVSVFFRVFDEKLTLTATYRTHNALDAWLKNVYGLMEAQRILADAVGIEMGPLTVVSHSISVDPSKYDTAKRIAESKKFSLQIDHNGQVSVLIDNGEIVLRHMDRDGRVLREYRSRRAERIQHELARDCAISDIGHAIYVGRQLARAEGCLRSGEEFSEE